MALLLLFLFSPHSKLAEIAICFDCVNLALSAKLLTRLYILLMFFLYFLIFSMVDFEDPVAQKLY